MKKLNRKGFTLVELLAVIVILAIVVGIAIPSVTKVINSSKTSGFETAMESAAGYLAKQAQLMSVDMGSLDPEFSSMDGSADGSIVDGEYNVDSTNFKSLWSKLGLKESNIQKFKIKVSEGKVCLTVSEIPTSSEYYTTAAWKPKTDNTSIATPQDGKVDVTFGAACN